MKRIPVLSFVVRHRWQPALHVLTCAFILCLVSGCGSADYETVPVSGCVTLNGEPMADVGLMFVPLARGHDGPNVGPGSLGRTDADGHFELQTARGEAGAVPTEHVVRISLAEQTDADNLSDDFTPEGDLRPQRKQPRVRLPVAAGDGSLHFTVPSEGTDQANFDLTSS